MLFRSGGESRISRVTLVCSVGIRRAMTPLAKNSGIFALLALAFRLWLPPRTSPSSQYCSEELFGILISRWAAVLDSGIYQPCRRRIVCHFLPLPQRVFAFWHGSDVLCAHLFL